jgi:CHASE2 domain-containing sensor protein
MSRLQRHTRLDVLLLTLLVVTVLVVLADAQPVRPFIVLLAACLVPGGAILTRLRTGERWTDLALAVGLSIAVEIGGSLVLVWSGWWHPEALGVALGAGSAALLVSDLLQGSRH